MKTISILLFCIIQSGFIYSQTYDFEYFNQNQSSNFRDVFFVDNLVGYASSYEGKIIKTSDGGETWTSTNLDSDFPIYGIYFIDENLGFAVGGDSECRPNPCEIPGSIVYKTTDGGNSWENSTLDKYELHAVYFLSESTGFVGGTGNLYKTKNGGMTWTSIELDDFYNIRELKFVNDSIGYLSALNGKMLKTIDCGNSWSLLNTGITSHIYSFDFWNANIGYAGGQGSFIKTVNGGNSWQKLSNAPSEIYSISCIDSNFIFASGRGIYSGGDAGYSYGAISYSTDGGNSWTIIDTLQNLVSVVLLNFPSNNVGYFVGAGSNILKLTNSNWSNSAKRFSTNIYCNVYPNPTCGKINFQMTEINNGFYFLLYDMKGRLLTNEYVVSEKYDMGRFFKGIYFYQIITEKNIYSGRIIKN